MTAKYSRMSIYDKSGIYLTEIDADIDRTWKINDYGKATFTISKEDVKAVYEYIRFGNLIYIEHNKLPAWAGVIDPPRDWASSQSR